MQVKFTICLCVVCDGLVCTFVCVSGVCRYHSCLWRQGTPRYQSSSSILLESEFLIVWPCVYQAVWPGRFWGLFVSTSHLTIGTHGCFLGIPTHVPTHVWLVLYEASLSLALRYIILSTPVQFSSIRYIPSGQPSPAQYATRTPFTPNQNSAPIARWLPVPSVISGSFYFCLWTPLG